VRLPDLPPKENGVLSRAFSPEWPPATSYHPALACDISSQQLFNECSVETIRACVSVLAPSGPRRPAERIFTSTLLL
jgi:hypothetical protein